MVISIDISKGLEMTEEEKDAFIEVINMEADYFPFSTAISDEEIALYKAILKERNENV